MSISDKIQKQKLIFDNLRDISLVPNKYSHNLQIKTSMIYRSASLSRYDSETVLSLIKDKNIKYILDLRGIKELELYRTSNNFYPNGLKEKYVINIPLEPFVATYIENDAPLNFYYAVLKDYREQIKEIFTNFFAEKANLPLIIHCEYGKDRTGIVIAILLESLGIDREYIIEDYLASKLDTKREYIELIFKVIDKECGGINNFLTNHCKIPNEKLSSIKKNLIEKV
jgi:protein tyrosine/serine phosphatase